MNNRTRGWATAPAPKGRENIERRETPQERYDRTHTTRINLKLNLKTDADILVYLADKQKQTEIKRCLRLVMAHEAANRQTD